MELVVPKRRVGARCVLSTGSVLVGHFYVAVTRADGRPETLAQRLNDTTERFLPIALETRHVLLRKSHLVTVEMPIEELGGEVLADTEAGFERKELRFQLDLWNGTSILGRTFARMNKHARALDYFNQGAWRFIDVVLDDRVMLVNGDYVAAVTEEVVADDEIGSWKGWEEVQAEMRAPAGARSRGAR
jgi:hypothetical protein